MKKPKHQGVVIESLPNLQFRVELQDGRILRCYTGGKVRLSKVKILVGDRVEIEHDESMGQIGRIVWRFL